MACLVHHIDVAKLLLTSGTNVHMKDLLGDSSLFTLDTMPLNRHIELLILQWHDRCSDEHEG